MNLTTRRLISVAAALAFSTVGALVSSRRPENPIGWLLVSSGLLYAVMVCVGEYGTYALLTENSSQPGGHVATWLGSWLYVLGTNLVLYSFLYFPDGRLPSPRWRVVAWLVALAVCLDTTSLALAPGKLYGFSGVENPFGIEALAGLSGLIGAATSVLALAAILVPIVALAVRIRGARGDERQQIKWVTYAVAVLVTTIVAVNLWPALDEFGLIPAIRQQAANYSQNGLSVSVEAPKSLPPLPAAVEVAAYRIVQEALTNFVRHAKAQDCRVRLSVESELELEITDVGVGLPEERHAGVGLSSMRERAAELGGTCLAESLPAVGPACSRACLCRLQVTPSVSPLT